LWTTAIAQLQSESSRVAEVGYNFGRVLRVMKAPFKIFLFLSKVPVTVDMQMLETVLQRSYFDLTKNLYPNFVACRYHLPDNMAAEHGYREHACTFGCTTVALHISFFYDLIYVY
jgi:hypothetical protein